MTGVSATRVVVRGLRKAYGDTKALDGLDLEAAGGEVLGVAGPNGAGKSTLVRILAGEEAQDGGEIELDGSTNWRSHAVQRVAVVHQEPQLFPNLTVAENILVGRETMRLGRPALGAGDEQLIAQLNIAPFVSRPLGLCSLATQQRTEIARALARDARVFLFDEPNSALTEKESQELFDQVHALAAAGRVVILVSHRLGDLATHASRVVVIRDGRLHAELRQEHLTQEEVARRLVVGKEPSAVPRAAAERREHGKVVLRLAGWSGGQGAFSEVDLEVRTGEIVALMGVEGSGGRELLRSIAGLEPAAGEIQIGGAMGRAALRRTSFVPATRQLSVFDNFDVGENVVSRLGGEISGPAMLLRRSRARKLAAEQVERFRVKTRSLRSGIRSLSGGNQQKVAIAAAVSEHPRVLLLEEPTRGVDLSSRGEIYRLLHEFAEAGNAVVIFCTEVSEVFDAADRVHVVSDGRLSGALEVRDAGAVEDLAAQITRLERHRSELEPAIR